MASPLFTSSSTEKPSILTISFADDPAGSLGAQLTKCDSVSDWHGVELDIYVISPNLTHYSLGFDCWDV